MALHAARPPPQVPHGSPGRGNAPPAPTRAPDRAGELQAHVIQHPCWLYCGRLLCLASEASPPPPFPQDFDRLVFPPAAAAVVISLFYGLLHALAPMVRAGGPCAVMCQALATKGAARALVAACPHPQLWPVPPFHHAAHHAGLCQRVAGRRHHWLRCL